jgi:hypothetical protein
MPLVYLRAYWTTFFFEIFRLGPISSIALEFAKQFSSSNRITSRRFSQTSSMWLGRNVTIKEMPLVALIYGVDVNLLTSID